MKYGLWENGKRIKWFSEQEANHINEGKLNYTAFFSLNESKQKIPRNEGFEPTKDFRVKFEMIRKAFPDVITELNVA